MSTVFSKCIGLVALFCAGNAYAEAVRIRVHGDYKAQTVIAYRENGGQATVKDQVEFEVDWDIREQKVIGPITFKNFKSEVSDLRNVELTCPPPKPMGEFEFIDITSVVDGGLGSIEIKGIRTYPEIDVTADCQGAWNRKHVKAKKEEVVEQGAMVDIDSGTFTLATGGPDQTDWNWTYTVIPKPTGVGATK